MGAPQVVFPDGVEGERRYIAPLWHPLWTERSVDGALYRRAVTYDSPVRFALTYLTHHITDPHTELIAFSPAHLDMASSAEGWIDPVAQHDAWVLARGGAKSTWLFLINPLWSLAHEHRKFLLAFAWTKDQAEGHLASIRHELEHNRLLLHDFPNLRRRKGPGSSDTKRTVTTSGATLMARGLGGSTLGVKSGEQRPDLIVGDDLEPDPARHTPETKEKIESLVVDSILPMGGKRTVVQLAGTTTMVGSLMHDVVRAALPAEDRQHRVAPWIRAHEFTCHYWPAILDEGTPAERSLWPQRWTLAELQRMRDVAPQDYALNYANRPETAGAGGYWTQNLIRYNARRDVTRRILFADVAMTNNKRSDKTALVMLGVTDEGRAVVEYAEAGRWLGAELLERMWKLTEANPLTLREWVVESNQGGERWDEILSPRPVGVSFDLEHVSGHKKDRIVAALKHYQRRAVEHVAPLPQLEDQQQEWTPASNRDDLLDALAGALRRAFLPVPA